MDQQELERLLGLFNQGDRSAFTTLYNEFASRIGSYANRFVRNKEEVKDIIIETFLKLWALRGNFRSIEDLTGFLYVTCKHTCIDFLRHAKMQAEKQEEILDAILKNDEPAAERDPVMEKAILLFYQEIEKLPKKSRAIMKMSYIEQIDHDEIARRMGISKKTVTNHKTSALRKIRIVILDKLYFTSFLIIFI